MPDSAERSLCWWQVQVSTPCFRVVGPAQPEATLAGQPRVCPLSIRERYRG